MRLEFKVVRVNRVEFGDATQIADGRLTLACAELRALLAADLRLAEVEIEITNPGDDCRIAGIFDIFEPRYKPDGRPNYPGVSDPIGRAGHGTTVVARGCAVLLIGGLPARSAGVVDMRGPGAELSPFARTANVCITSRPGAGVAKSAYYRALKEAGAKASAYLGQAASQAQAQETEVYDLVAGSGDESGAALPRVAYIYTIASQQIPTEAGEPILYGDNVRHLLPTVLHPNEVLDGAVVTPYWNFGGVTYSAQNHPMVRELYRRHGRELTFAGVIAIIAAENETERKRNAIMAATLARETLQADAVVMTKYGGGIPESVLMETYDACEDVGIKGTMVLWTHGGDGRIEGSLTFMSPRANAVVSCGITDELIHLPKPARVIGAAQIGPVLSIDRGSEIYAANEAVRLTHQFMAGGIDQFGANRLSIEEY
jgi:glycine reductase